MVRKSFGYVKDSIAEILRSRAIRYCIAVVTSCDRIVARKFDAQDILLGADTMVQVGSIDYGQENDGPP